MWKFREQMKERTLRLVVRAAVTLASWREDAASGSGDPSSSLVGTALIVAGVIVVVGIIVAALKNVGNYIGNTVNNVT